MRFYEMAGGICRFVWRRWNIMNATLNSILLKGALAFIGAAIFAVMFGGIAMVLAWDVPAWAYFIVAWMGHNDAYDYLKYKHGL
jgi:hypothetical protein